MRRAAQIVRSLLPGTAGLAFVVLVVLGVLEVPACRAVFAPPPDTETPSPADAQVAETATPEDAQPPESQSAEDDPSGLGPSAAAVASESQDSGPSRPERRRRPRPQPPDWNPREMREMLLPGLLMTLANGLFSLASIGAFVFVFAGVVAKKGSRWRGSTATGLRWAVIGSIVTIIGYSIRRGADVARTSIRLQETGWSPREGPVRSFPEAFWGSFTYQLWPLLAAVGCGFVFAAIGLWAYRRRQQRPPQSEHGLDAPAESHHA